MNGHVTVPKQIWAVTLVICVATIPSKKHEECLNLNALEQCKNTQKQCKESIVIMLWDSNLKTLKASMHKGFIYAINVKNIELLPNWDVKSCSGFESFGGCPPQPQKYRLNLPVFKRLWGGPTDRTKGLI